MIAEMGLLCGGSCGAAMAEAVKAAKDLKKGQRCVVMLPDSVRNYMTKFLSNDWMIAEGFFQAADIYQGDEPWRAQTVGSLDVPKSEFVIFSDQTVGVAIKTFIESGATVLPLLEPKNRTVIGAVSQAKLLSKLNTKWCKPEDSIMKAKIKIRVVKQSTTLGTLAAIFNCDEFVGVEGLPSTLIFRSHLLRAISPY